jgi:type IV pilus biogenesis protein CpaD/CtpE
MKTTTHHFDKLVSKALDSTITEAEGDHLRAILKNILLSRRDTVKQS